MRREAAFLGDILAEADIILVQLDRCTKDQFLTDPILSRGILHSLMIIGEAANRIPDTMRTVYPQVPWRDLAALRHRIVHDYPGIDLDLVWALITSRLGPLRAEIAAILETDYPPE